LAFYKSGRSRVSAEAKTGSEFLHNPSVLYAPAKVVWIRPEMLYGKLISLDLRFQLSSTCRISARTWQTQRWSQLLALWSYWSLERCFSCPVETRAGHSNITRGPSVSLSGVAYSVQRWKSVGSAGAGCRSGRVRVFWPVIIRKIRPISVSEQSSCPRTSTAKKPIN